jgi:hypothetical protein
LYPYDGTVWPRGLPAPLLQWRHGAHTARAVKISIEVGTDFAYEGYFGPPAALPANQPIVHLPIPRQVWRNALYSGSEMKVSLVIAASDGAGGFAAFAPAAPLTWKIAPGSLKGTVYYNTYGSELAKQHDGKGGRFGGATLAIRGSSTNPSSLRAPRPMTTVVAACVIRFRATVRRCSSSRPITWSARATTC